MRTVTRRVVMTLALPAVLLAAWWFASAGSESFYWPSLRSILNAFGETWTPDRFRSDVLPSMGRLAAGYGAALVLGTTLGTVIGSWSTVRRMFEPVIEFLRSIPPTVLIPVLLVLIGIDDSMKIAVIVSGCVWPILLNVIEGVRGVDPVLRDTAAGYHVPWWRRLTTLTLPAAAPRIFVGARQALSIALILMVVSEMFAATNGLGFTVVQFQRSFQIPQMWSGILLLGLIGVALSVLFAWVERRVLSWYFGLRATEGHVR